MKKIIWMALISLVVSCKKSGTPPAPPGTPGVFPKNTEWAGTLDGSGFEYRRPCALKFNADNTFTMYANFLYYDNNGGEIRRDSISGSIASMDTLPDTRVRISTNIVTSFNGVVTKYIYIASGSKMTGVSADGNTATFQLGLFPAAGYEIKGTRWKGAAWPKSGVTLIPYACPDLSSIFYQADGTTLYSRDGQPVMLTQFVALQSTYAQKGSRLYMAGYKFLPGNPEGAAVLINRYFGVMLPPGDKMLVDSYSPAARLPNYLDGKEPYGPNGQTPAIYKY